MITGHVFIAASLDGFIARRDGKLDWLEKQVVAGEEHGYAEMMASVDGLIMGRGSFEKVLTFGEWPYEKPVVVMSRSLEASNVPDHLADQVRVSDATPVGLMEQLANEGWGRAYVDGGRVIQSFLRHDLIDDMVLTRIPILIGEGLPLFGSVPRDIDLEHVETTVFPSGLVSSKYRIAKNKN